MTNTYLVSETRNVEEIRNYVNGINKKIPSIMFFRGDVKPDFEIPGKDIKRAEYYGFEILAMEIFESSGRKIVRIHTFDRRNEEPMDFCFVLE